MGQGLDCGDAHAVRRPARPARTRLFLPAPQAARRLHVVVPAHAVAGRGVTGAGEEFLPRLCRAHGRGGTGPLRRACEDRRPARPHPHRLAAQRDRQHGDRLVLSARPPGRHGRDAARLGRGNAQLDPRRASRCGPCRTGSRVCGRIRGTAFSKPISGADLVPARPREAARKPALPASASAPRARIVVARKPRKR